MKEKTKQKFQEEYAKIMSDSINEYDKVDIVKVVWTDAHTEKDTLNLEGIRKTNLGKAITIGFLMDENEERLAICGFCFPDEEHDIQDPKGFSGFRDVHFVPKKLIKSILILTTDWEASKKRLEESK